MNKTFIIILIVALFFVGKYFYMKPSQGTGESAFEFEAKLIDGSSFKLSDLKGQYVLVDFWGSWCGPCRKANPKLVQLHNQFKDTKFEDASGFQILSIGIEESELRWKNAIQKDGLNWKYHVLDKTESLRFFNSPIATQFGIKEVPTTFLLNPDGLIIATNATAEKMAATLSEKIR